MPLRLQLPLLVPDSIVKHFDTEIRPPRGGWSYPIAGEIVTKYSEGAIVGELKRWRVNNNTFVSDEALMREVWQYWCDREPERCGQLPGASSGSARLFQPRPVTKELQGPPIWTFLNTIAVQWTEGLHPYFLATCNAILGVLECPDCRGEWRRLLNDYPPASIASRVAACQWVNLVHNEVNKRKGGSIYPYQRMVTEWGAPLA